ncbi:MAG: hypothetical protein ACK5O8_11100 [Pirellula sp.]
MWNRFLRIKNPLRDLGRLFLMVLLVPVWTPLLLIICICWICVWLTVDQRDVSDGKTWTSSLIRMDKHYMCDCWSRRAHGSAANESPVSEVGTAMPLVAAP